MANLKPAVPSALVKEAALLDQELREQFSKWKKQARVVGGLLKTIMDKQLHRYIHKPGSKRGYARFEDYVSDLTGGMANSTIWAMMRIHGLTEGINALPGPEVDAMPQENAYQLSRLKPEQRSADLVRKAKQMPIKKFQAEIQEIRNASLPPERREPVFVDFREKWPVELVDLFEEVVADFSLLAAIRDGDREISIRHKAIMAILVSARTYAGDDIQLARAELATETPEFPEMHEGCEPAVMPTLGSVIRSEGDESNGLNGSSPRIVVRREAGATR